MVNLNFFHFPALKKKTKRKKLTKKAKEKWKSHKVFTQALAGQSSSTKRTCIGWASLIIWEALGLPIFFSFCRIRKGFPYIWKWPWLYMPWCCSWLKFQLCWLSFSFSQLCKSKGIPNSALVRLSVRLGQYLDMATATLAPKTWVWLNDP